MKIAFLLAYSSVEAYFLLNVLANSLKLASDAKAMPARAHSNTKDLILVLISRDCEHLL